MFCWDFHSPLIHVPQLFGLLSVNCWQMNTNYELRHKILRNSGTYLLDPLIETVLDKQQLKQMTYCKIWKSFSLCYPIRSQSIQCGDNSS